MAEQSIHLQGFGLHLAKPAAELKAGDITVWNTGSTAKVVSVSKRGMSVYVVLDVNGKVYPERRFLGTRLVACTGLGKPRPTQATEEMKA